MYKNGPPPPYEPPPYAPPAYSQNVGGVPPASPFTPAQTCKFLTYIIIYSHKYTNTNIF